MWLNIYLGFNDMNQVGKPRLNSTSLLPAKLGSKKPNAVAIDIQPNNGRYALFTHMRPKNEVDLAVTLTPVSVSKFNTDTIFSGVANFRPRHQDFWCQRIRYRHRHQHFGCSRIQHRHRHQNFGCSRI